MLDLNNNLGPDDIRWQVYVDGSVKGPFTPDEMASIYSMGIITEDSPIKQVTWPQWQKCGDVLKAFQARYHSQEPVAINAGNAKRKVVAKRLSLHPGSTDVLIHDQKCLVRTYAVDISKSGLFVAAQRLDFNLSAVISLTFKAPDFIKPFNARARIVRFNADLRYPIGYGLEFVEVPQALQWCSKLD